jgi:hypothetical protein
MSDHASRSTALDSPLTKAFVAMDHDDRWVNRSPEVMLDSFHWFRGEGFGFIVDDLLALPAQPPVVVEGFRLLPRLVAPLLATPRQAVWLIPTPALRRFAFERRRPTGAPWSFVEQTSDPARALANLIERDRMFTDRVAQEASDLGLRTIVVDVTMSEDDVEGQVRDRLGL